jgi:5,10-methylenetetrahydrofolate reductase
MTTTEATAACPKRMTYGPCGGVGFDGSCEIDASLGCPFVPMETVKWHGFNGEQRVGVTGGGAAATGADAAAGPHRGPAQSGSARMRALISARRIVVADFPARALDAQSIRDCAEILVGSVDAVLSGDSGADRVQFSPTYRARLILDAGLMPWNGVNCRDRNRVALEGELAGLADVGTGGVHCVTGDHTQTGSRPDAMPVFDLDSTELAALARAAGHLVSVGESPTTPPLHRRAARLLEKERAGAELCFVNHCGGAGPVAAFIAAARALGSRVGFIPCIPIVLDEGSANLLRSFTTLVLPPGYLEGILAAADVREAGIEAAVALSMAMLEIDGVVGVDLSGGAAPGDELDYARAVAEIGRRLAGVLPHPVSP